MMHFSFLLKMLGTDISLIDAGHVLFSGFFETTPCVWFLHEVYPLLKRLKSREVPALKKPPKMLRCPLQ